MISILKRFLHKNKGFSLIEVILTVSIIGILTAGIIPSYNYIAKEHENLKSEKFCVELESKIKTFLIESRYRLSNYRNPIVSTNSSVKGTIDISESDINLNLQKLLQSYEPTKNGMGKATKTFNWNLEPVVKELTVTFEFKDGYDIIFEFSIYDNHLNQYDYAYLEKMTYQNDSGYTKTISLNS